MTPVEAAAVTARFAQFAGAGVATGAAAFFVHGIRPEAAAVWPRRLVRLAAAISALGTLAWLMSQAAALGAPADAFAPAKVWTVAADTGFGRFALARLALLLLALATVGVGWRLTAVLGAAACATFAWTGHAAGGDGLAGVLHSAADVVHAVAAALWVGALVVLAILTGQARGGLPERRTAAHDGLARFSALGVWLVVALVASGVANTLFLVGPSGVLQLRETLYGRVLIAKLAAFAVMLALAAANRWRHTESLARDPESGRAAAASVLVETLLAGGVLALVGWLGTLSPDGMS